MDYLIFGLHALHTIFFNDLLSSTVYKIVFLGEKKNISKTTFPTPTDFQIISPISIYMIKNEFIYLLLTTWI